MKFTLECEKEKDGRWLAEVPEIPGAMAYGTTSKEALRKAEALAFRALAERLENKESNPLSISVSIAA